VLILAVPLLVFAPATLAATGRPSVACGDTITQDTRLTVNLTDCPGTGLVVGADGITLDLAGHTIDGDGIGDDAGIDVERHRSVTVVGGTVRQFTEGVLVLGGRSVTVRGVSSVEHGHGGITADGTRDLVVEGNIIRDDGAGIIVASTDAALVRANRVSASAFGGISAFASRDVRVAGNTVTGSINAAVGLLHGSSSGEVVDNTLSRNGAGVALDSGASDNVVAHNAIARNDSGVLLDVGTHDNRVLDNAVLGSAFEGIAVVGSDANLVARNAVARNGGAEAAGGIVVIPLPDDPAQTSDFNTLAGNLAIDNRGDGIVVGPGQRQNVLRANRADRNSALGMGVAAGTIDSGGNLAARNGDARQCDGIVCSPSP
jgi:parallel beta-helix repeat protein